LFLIKVIWLSVNVIFRVCIILGDKYFIVSVIGILDDAELVTFV